MRDVPKMIALDMDGTLVHPGGTVTEVNQVALQRARDAGARIVVATGRRHSYAMKILSNGGFHAEDILLSSNGAVARRLDGQLLFRQELPLAAAQWLCQAVNAYRNCFVLTFDTVNAQGEEAYGALVVEELDALHARIEKWMTTNAYTIRRVQPIENALRDTDAPPIQAMLCGGLERMDRAYAELNAVNDGRVSLSRTIYPERDLSILDILPADCSKGAGLERLLAMEKLTAHDLMAVGDNWNDESMLGLARWPVLMGNAPAELRRMGEAKGWTITCHHFEDGVAEGLEKFFPAT